MKTQFPAQPGFAGMFLLGVRKSESGQTQRVATALVKRSYDVEPTSGRLVPSSQAASIRMQDVAENLLSNSDFALSGGSGPEAWNSTATLSVAPPPLTVPPAPVDLELRAFGSARLPIVQTLAFDEPPLGESFVLSLYARRGSQSARIENVELRLNDSVSICSINQTLTPDYARYEATGTWPLDADSSELQVILRTPTVSNREVFYGRVQVEQRSHRTRWDSAEVLRYEHDLAPFKPHADVVVLGLADAPGEYLVRVNEVPWLKRQISPFAIGEKEKAVFGWEPRTGSPREAFAGTFPSAPDAYPLEDPLPADFDNRFYNGHRLPGAGEPSPQFRLPTPAHVEIHRDTTRVYRVQVPPAHLESTYYVASSASDEPATWTRHSLPTQVDTLLIEPEVGRCHLTWRADWNWDDHSEELYRQLDVQYIEPRS